MNDFEEAFSQVFPNSLPMFGETCIIGGSTFNCIVDMLEATNEVDNNRPGRSHQVEGVVTMSRTDWLTASGKKGIQITLLCGTFRVINDPLKSFETSTVELRLGPLS